MKPLSLLLLVCLFAASGVGYWLFKEVKESGYDSCVLSIEDAFRRALLTDPELSRRITVSDKWRSLDEDEKRMLFDKFIAAGRTFDCRQFGEYSDGEALRGDQNKIYVRKWENSLLVRLALNEGYTRRYAFSPPGVESPTP